MYELTKLSTPGWQKQFPTVLEAYTELQHYICDNCIEEFISLYSHDPEDIYDLLWTACGAEFMFEQL